MIDLFRPLLATDIARRLADLFSPDAEGRIFIGQGERVEAFERAFCALIGAVEPPLALCSGTAALDLALKLAGVGPGDEVISTPITCTATNGAIANAGARIVWADVDPTTGNIDPADVVRKVSAHTKAIMAVNWGGRPCDYEALRHASPLRYCPVIEDAAHGPFGAPEGGDYTCWSFQAIKHLTTGDGGALLSNCGDMERGRLLRWYGLDRRSSADFRCAQDIAEIGQKWHMNDIAATIGLANLSLAEWSVARSRLNAEYYHRALSGLPGLAVPPLDPACSYWLFTILADDRDGLAAHLANRGIATSQAHARNDKHAAFRAVSSGWPLPGVDHFDAHQTNIPCGWWVTEQDREHIAGAVQEWVSTRREGRAA
jgi:perosamine synthetase